MALYSRSPSLQSGDGSEEEGPLGDVPPSFQHSREHLQQHSRQHSRQQRPRSRPTSPFAQPMPPALLTVPGDDGTKRIASLVFPKRLICGREYLQVQLGSGLHFCCRKRRGRWIMRLTSMSVREARMKLVQSRLRLTNHSPASALPPTEAANHNALFPPYYRRVSSWECRRGLCLGGF